LFCFYLFVLADPIMAGFPSVFSLDAEAVVKQCRIYAELMFTLEAEDPKFRILLRIVAGMLELATCLVEENTYTQPTNQYVNPWCQCCSGPHWLSQCPIAAQWSFKWQEIDRERQMERERAYQDSSGATMEDNSNPETLMGVGTPPQVVEGSHYDDSPSQVPSYKQSGRIDWYDDDEYDLNQCWSTNQCTIEDSVDAAELAEEARPTMDDSDDLTASMGDADESVDDMLEKEEEEPSADPLVFDLDIYPTDPIWDMSDISDEDEDHSPSWEETEIVETVAVPVIPIAKKIPNNIVRYVPTPAEVSRFN
jgi:hypothetical protein